MIRRPTIAFAMLEGLAQVAFTHEQLARLHEVGVVLDRAPLTDFGTERAAAVLAEAEVLIGHWGCPPLTTDVLDRCPKLGLFAYAAGTVKWQVTEAVWDRGIVVTSAAAANAVPVAEYTVAMIVLANKGALLFAARERDPGAGVRVNGNRVGNVDKRVGLVGASHVGRLVIEMLRPYDLEIGVADPYLSTDEAARLGVRLMTLDELCRWCDVLSLHAPDVPSTRGMIGAEQLAALHSGVTVINTARGALVDHDALLAEVASGRLNAVLDVTEPEPLPADSPLRSLPNVVLTPHIAGAMGLELRRLGALAVEEVERFADGRAPRYPVTAADLDRIA